ncbi:iron-sulfur cluster binding protein [Desulfitobacterium sp. AusDCA]|uniref:iron-sulfur cluster binding protein n=1 Tax=Desulfitobacterium sp. AusDCA TaxID=3240383 RepID=UPI003DA754F1
MQSLNLENFPDIELPKFLKIKQNFSMQKVENVKQELLNKVTGKLIGLEGKRIAIGVGSRGISNIDLITKTLIYALKKAGAIPFIVPAMGSHGGATSEGQLAILSSLNVKPETMEVEFDASMDVEKIGYVDDIPVYFSSSALRADFIIIIARIKPHTCFRGEVESGICKMLTIGLGKQIGASSLHSLGYNRFAEIIPKAASVVVSKAPILFAVGIIENAYDEIFKLEIVERNEIPLIEREAHLLRESRQVMGKIILDEFDVLVIDEIGKEISGDGQDPNVTGLYNTKNISSTNCFQKSVAFDLTEQSHGNACGVGAVDIITRTLFDKIDFVKTYANTFTSRELGAAKIPMVAATKEDALRIAVKTCRGNNTELQKIVWIKNTLKLGEIIVSESLLSEVKKNPQLEILTEAQKIKFNHGEPEFPWRF